MKNTRYSFLFAVFCAIALSQEFIPEIYLKRNETRITVWKDGLISERFQTVERRSCDMVKPMTMHINDKNRSILKLHAKGGIRVSRVSMEVQGREKQLIQANDLTYDLVYSCNSG